MEPDVDTVTANPLLSKLLSRIGTSAAGLSVNIRIEAKDYRPRSVLDPS